jgi:ribosomal protein L40E
MPPPDCPFCEHQNPADAKFCNECGSPLHLTPCGGCGAVNSVGDTHCWRCGELLLPVDTPVLSERVERAPAVPEQLAIELLSPTPLPTEQELEQELVALEQEVQALERAPAPAAALPPVFEHAPRERGIPRPKTADPRPRRAERAFPGSTIPELKSLFVPADDAPRGRRALIVTAFVLALGSVIAVGAYLLDRDRGSPETAASAPPPSQTRAAPAMAPRPATDVAAAPVVAPARPLPPGLKALETPVEPRIASDAGEAPAVAAPAAASEPGCPPAVEAMALCEWLRAHPQ